MNKPDLYLYEPLEIEGLACRLMACAHDGRTYSADESDADKIRWLISVCEYARWIESERVEER